jgi:hypothetical protein
MTRCFRNGIAVFASLIFFLAGGLSFADEAVASPNLAICTNLAYLALSAVSTSPSNAFVIVPVEVQAGIGGSFTLNPAATVIYFSSARSTYSGVLAVAECGFAFYPAGNSRSGWNVALSPGIAYAFDSGSAGFVLSAEGGWRWLFAPHWLCEISLGARYVRMDGNLFLPDVKLRLGWRL